MCTCRTRLARNLEGDRLNKPRSSIHRAHLPRFFNARDHYNELSSTMIQMRLLFLIGVVVWQATDSNAVIPLNRVIRSVNAFSENLVKAIAEDVSGNLVCSPVSADMVLSMAAFGARGHTEEVLRSALALSDEDYDSLMLNGYQDLHDTLASAKGFELRMANKMYLAKGFEPNADFREAIETGFRSSPENINFVDPSKAATTINHQIEVQTNNHIKDLVKEADFDSTTTLVLVNAIYFNASWEAQFAEYYTKPRPFHVNGEDPKNVTTMWNFGIYRLGELPEIKAKFVELPYKSEKSIDDVSMFIILPDEINGIGELVKNLDKVTVHRLLRGTRRTVRVYLPKFKIESAIDLKEPLTKLGLEEIFTDSADFTGIVSSPPLKVSKIVQKAFIEVNEKGTEATAATKMAYTYRTWNEDVKYDPIDFNADHPFVAVIATKRGLPLFSSVVVEPIY